MFNFQKWLLIGWLIILTIGIITVSVYILKRLTLLEKGLNGIKKQIEEVEEEMTRLKEKIEQLKKKVSVEPEEIDISDWGTYRFEKPMYKVGYEVNYPPNWAMEDLKDIWEVKWYAPKRIPENIVIDIAVLPVVGEGNFDPINCVSLLSPYRFEITTMYDVIGKEKIGGNEFCKVTYKGGEQKQIVQSIEYVIVKGEYQYRISLWIMGGRQTQEYYLPENEFQEELNIFNQVLSTFRFIP